MGSGRKNFAGTTVRLEPDVAMAAFDISLKRRIVLCRVLVHIAQLASRLSLDRLFSRRSHVLHRLQRSRNCDYLTSQKIDRKQDTFRGYQSI